MWDGDEPILVVGAARSGTTLVAERLLAPHDRIVYWPEPVFVWRYGNAYRATDVLGPEHARPEVKRYIRRRFRERREQGDGDLFLEKTPSNSLRLPFVLEVFPDARVIHVIRDGRDAARSTAQEWAGRGGQALEYEYLREGGRIGEVRSGLETWLRLGERVDDWRSLLELPAYTGRLVGFLARRLFKTSRIPWGPRFPGIWRMRGSLGLLDTCALQWDLCVRMARSAAVQMSPDRYLEIRYEDVVRAPGRVLEVLLGFLDLELTERRRTEIADQVVERDLPVWESRLDEAEVRSMERLVGDTLTELGYSLKTGSGEAT